MVGTIVDRTGPVSVLKVRLEGDEVVSRQVKLCLSSFARQSQDPCSGPHLQFETHFRQFVKSVGGPEQARLVPTSQNCGTGSPTNES